MNIMNTLVMHYVLLWLGLGLTLPLFVTMII